MSDRLSKRIIDHLKQRFNQTKYENTDSLLNNIPEYLRQEIVAITHRQVYSKISFFIDCSKTSPQLGVQIIHQLRPLSLAPNEMLYQEGDEAKDIYFIQQGRVKLYADMNNHIHE